MIMLTMLLGMDNMRQCHCVHHALAHAQHADEHNGSATVLIMLLGTDNMLCHCVHHSLAHALDGDQHNGIVA
jgi:hypothetical protein